MNLKNKVIKVISLSLIIFGIAFLFDINEVHAEGTITTIPFHVNAQGPLGNKIAGVKFAIYDSHSCTGTPIKEGVTETGLGYTTDLPDRTTYCVKVTEVPAGYETPDSVTGTLSSSDDTATIKLVSSEDVPTKGTLTLSFKDSSSGKYISGVEYSIYSKKTSSGCSGSILEEGTSINGSQTITLNLSNSNYCLKVTDISDLYTAPEDTAIDLSRSITKSINVDKKVIVDDTMSNISIALIIAGIIGLGSGAYLIYKNIQEKRVNEK